MITYYPQLQKVTCFINVKNMIIIGYIRNVS